MDQMTAEQQIRLTFLLEIVRSGGYTDLADAIAQAKTCVEFVMGRDTPIQ